MMLNRLITIVPLAAFVLAGIVYIVTLHNSVNNLSSSKAEKATISKIEAKIEALEKDKNFDLLMKIKEEALGEIKEAKTEAKKEIFTEDYILQLNTATQDINRNENKVNNLIDNLKKWGDKSQDEKIIFGGKTGESPVGLCPDGYYVAGISVIDNDAGGYCISCIQGVRIICRPLNLPTQ
jgi:hypothetical protein